MVQFRVQYPTDPEYKYLVQLERINLDKERVEDLITGKGFTIKTHQSIKKDLKNPEGIFSTEFGPTLQDVNAFANRYKCECGHLQQRIHDGITCLMCGTKVRYMGDDFKKFGWICLKDPYYIIHPNLYKSLEFFISAKKLNRILNVTNPISEDGFDIINKKDNFSKDEMFYDLGMMGFKDRFDEIMDYYLQQNPNKKEYYDNIMESKDIIFAQSIPVYTLLLRPFRIEGDVFSFEGTNKEYNMCAKLAADINKDELTIQQNKRQKNQLLYSLQVKLNELYQEIEKILSEKKGVIRSLFGGRYNFTARAVISPKPSLRIDQITLPYAALIELLQQRIINILQKSYNISYSDAYKIWYKAQINKNNRVYDIIQYLINDSPNGLPMMINRNPTINYGGILQSYCVGIENSYTMGVPLQILKIMGADFDGDCLNILYLINQAFIAEVERVFNPRNSMFISRNDGMFNNDVNHSRDTLINANTLINISRDRYTQDQIDRIRYAQQCA